MRPSRSRLGDSVIRSSRMTFSAHTGAVVQSMQRYGAQAGTFVQGRRRGEQEVVVLDLLTGELRGEVDIVSTNAKRERVVLTTLGKGQLFGDLALMAESRRTASAIARTPCELMALSQDVLKKKLEAADPLLRFWVAYLGERVIALSKRATS